MIKPEALFQNHAQPASPADPLAHLQACHRRIEDRLATLERAAAHLDGAPEAAREAFQSVFRFMDSSGALHTDDEEQSLFPRLQTKVDPMIGAYLTRLEDEHDQAEALYNELKAAVSGHAAQAKVESLAGQLCDLYRGHIASEDHVLQDFAERLLSTEERAAIAAEMTARRRG